VRYIVESEGRVKVYEQLLSGAPPRPLASFKDSDEFDFDWSPDGRKLAYMSSEWHHDIVLIGGLK
jgi:Tol biopolymer transport system component